MVSWKWILLPVERTSFGMPNICWRLLAGADVILVAFRYHREYQRHKPSRVPVSICAQAAMKGLDPVLFHQHLRQLLSFHESLLTHVKK